LQYIAINIAMVMQYDGRGHSGIRGFNKNKTRQRELDGLLNAAEELNIKNLTIITEDQEGEEKIGKLKIEIIPIWKWLASLPA
jgi:predicted AAA+ superfamily ATPase